MITNANSVNLLIAEEKKHNNVTETISHNYNKNQLAMLVLALNYSNLLELSFMSVWSPELLQQNDFGEVAAVRSYLTF